jgi:hypothetical protein
MVRKIFQAKGFPWFWDFMLGYDKTMKFRSSEKFFIAVFEFIGQFCFQNDVFKPNQLSKSFRFFLVGPETSF